MVEEQISPALNETPGPIKVSVLMITYNHEKYISQAVNSVLSQETDFEYELVIGEDCSTDRTPEILRSIKERYPDKINLIINQDNLGVVRNFANTLKSCQGKYIAILEGDDYWTSHNKLQKQVDFLDDHPEFVICFHNVYVTYEDGTRDPYPFCRENQKEISTLEDLLISNFIPTCSAMFRNGLIDRFPDWYFALPMGDYPLHVLNAQYGKIAYIDEIFSVYRKHSGGIWSSINYLNLIQSNVMFYEIINKFFRYRYEYILRPKLIEVWRRLEVEYIEKGYQRGLVDVSIGHIEKIFNEIPSEIPVSRRWKSRVLGEIYERLLFASYINDRIVFKTRYCWMKLVKYKLSSLKNPGVLSIGFEMLVGRWLMYLLRNIKKSLSH